MAEAPEPNAGDGLMRAGGWRRRWEATSLAFRLFILATAWSLAALVVAGFFLMTWYRGTVERGFQTLLDVYSLNLVASVEQRPDGELAGTPNLGEPRFAAFHSGWYWQATVEGRSSIGLGSPSLAGERLAMPPVSEAPYDAQFRRIAVLEGPTGRRLLAVERTVIFDSSGDQLSFLVTGDLGDVEAEIDAFRTRLALVFGLLGMGLVTISVMQVRLGLRPLRRLRHALAAIREGKTAYLEGEYPGEIMPLVRELNSLIQSNTKVVERARTHVGNLAHALKTPLSVLLNEARGDSAALADKVVEQSQVMRHHLDLYLDRARMAGRSRVLGAVCEIRPVAEALVRAMERIYEEKAVTLTLECPDGLRFRGERQDLEEMLGNLVDNASKWAGHRVAVRVASPAGDELAITIDDDGPGLPAEQRAEALKRGQRLDTSRPGSGLGLSIVAELVDLYEGSLKLEDSPLGGLRASLRLPRA